MATSSLLALSTCPNAEVAQTIAENLVREQHAACVNIIPAIQSIYVWQGSLCQDHEFLLLIKTTEAAYPALEQAWRRLHPYELPELICIPITGGYLPYLNWVQTTTSAVHHE